MQGTMQAENNKDFVIYSYFYERNFSEAVHVTNRSNNTVYAYYKTYLSFHKILRETLAGSGKIHTYTNLHFDSVEGNLYRS